MNKIDPQTNPDLDFEASELDDQQASTSTVLAKHKTTALAAMIVSTVLLVLVIILIFLLVRNHFERDKVYQEAYNTGIINQRDIDRVAFKEQLATPYTVYQAPDIYGGFKISYPKNYSTVYNNNTSNPVSIIAHPDKVDLNTDRFALRIELIESPYSQEKAKALDQDSKLDKGKQGYLIKVAGLETAIT